MSVIGTAEALHRLQQRNARAIRDAVDDLAAAKLSGDPRTYTRSFDALAALLRDEGQVGALLGAWRLLVEVDALKAKRSYADAIPPVISVEAEDAVASLLERRPELASTWQEVQAAWTERRGFALARSADVVLTGRIQTATQHALARGDSLAVATREIRRLAQEHGLEFSEGYAATVHRTVTASAFTEGRMRQARSPAVRAVAPGWRFDATLDPDVRPNHKAADGFVAHQDDPVWRELAPPLGFQCRCALALATAAEVRKAGAMTKDGTVRYRRAPAGAEPDEGFKALG